MKEVQKIFRKRGIKALEMARKEILEEKIEYKQVKEAITYFVMKYWHDLARPSLLSMTCEAVGGDPEATIPVAVPMILISGAIDIHDDIIDQSRTKDGRPTIYGKYGKDIALLVGDAFLFKGFTLLNHLYGVKDLSPKMATIIDIIKDMFFELGNAEAMELPLRGRTDISPSDYLRIVRKKAADVEAHTKISVVVGGGSKQEIEALSNYGRLLGMLLILRDDWIDLMTPEETRSRIKRECLPLPLLYSLQNLNAKPQVLSILKKSVITRKDVQTILEIIYKSGGQKQFEKLLQELKEKASEELRTIKCPVEGLSLLLEATIPTFEENALSNSTAV
jgi:geranylgeranyl diphosphate synthase type I